MFSRHHSEVSIKFPVKTLKEKITFCHDCDNEGAFLGKALYASHFLVLRFVFPVSSLPVDVDGGWTPWASASFGPCSATCGGTRDEGEETSSRPQSSLQQAYILG